MLESASARSVSSSSCHFPCRSYSTFSIPMSSLRMSYVVKLIPVDSGLCITTHHEQTVNAKHDTHIIPSTTALRTRIQLTDTPLNSPRQPSRAMMIRAVVMTPV